MATKKDQKIMSKAEGRIPPITIRNATLIYRNFAGVAKKYNAAGLRNFHIKLDLETAEMLKRDGWNVKIEDPREEGDPPLAHIKVALGFDRFPPRIMLISGKNSSARTILDAESVSILDFADIEKVDLTISGSYWEKGKDHGIKAWLRKAMITLSPDDLESEYMTVSDKPTIIEEDD